MIVTQDVTRGVCVYVCACVCVRKLSGLLLTFYYLYIQTYQSQPKLYQMKCIFKSPPPPS